MSNRARALEVDFLILIPEYYAVVCLECKGGKYKILRDEGLWENTRTRGRIRSPFVQVRGFLTSLKDELREFRKSNTSIQSSQSLVSLSCAVFLPDSNYPGRAKYTEEALILEPRHARDPDKFVQKIKDYAESAQTRGITNRLQNDIGKRLAEDEFYAIQEYIESDVTITREPETITRRDLESLKPRLLRLTEEQKNGLQAPNINRRCVVDGAAGTGKTVLAQEIARRRSENQRDIVGMLCSNPVLATRLTNWAATLDSTEGGGVIVGTPASLPGRVFAIANEEDAGIMHELRLGEAMGVEESLKFGYVREEWRSFIGSTIEDLPPGGFFDYLVVDEAQNLCDDMFLDLMDRMLKGGLAGGDWAMFGDFANQNIVSPGLQMDVRGRLEERRAFFSNVNLTINCRNTEDIAHEVNKLVGIDAPALSGVYGPDVEFEYFSTQDELMVKLDRKIGRWKRKSFRSWQIVLLSSGDTKCFDTTQTCGGWSLVNVRETVEGASADHNNASDLLNVSDDRIKDIVRYSDVFDFQGLGKRHRGPCSSPDRRYGNRRRREYKAQPVPSRQDVLYWDESSQVHACRCSA